MPTSRSSGASHIEPSKRRRAKSRNNAKNGAPVCNATRAQFDDLVGQGADLWTDEEFQRFQAWLRERRLRGE
jgi:hypothetical protein